MITHARAKINLSVDVLAKQPDGYHTVRLIMQSVTLHDRMRIEFSEKPGVSVKTDLRYLPSDDGNIAAKAAKLFYASTGIAGGCDIAIEKTVPVCAGLGGGSGDAAAVLRSLNRHYNAGLSRGELEALAKALGSDVPFCVAGGTVLAEGRGELLTALPALPHCWIVICKPAFSISTPKLFAAINCERIHYRPDTDGIIDALRRGDLAGVACRMYNVFEDVLGSRAKTVREIKSTLLDSGALGACMSGTGSAVFGIFADKESAKRAHTALITHYKEAFLAESCDTDENV